MWIFFPLSHGGVFCNIDFLISLVSCCSPYYDIDFFIVPSLISNMLLCIARACSSPTHPPPPPLIPPSTPRDKRTLPSLLPQRCEDPFPPPGMWGSHSSFTIEAGSTRGGGCSVDLGQGYSKLGEGGAEEWERELPFHFFYYSSYYRGYRYICYPYQYIRAV